MAAIDRSMGLYPSAMPGAHDAEDCRLVRGALDGVWRYYEVTSKAPVEIAAAANDGFV